jgi:cobalt-zinc-cadmium efflux system protein
MAHGHHDDAQGHSHDRAQADRRALLTALVLILGLLVAEVVFGILAGSLALLADAGHMLTDAAALAMALGASSMSQRPASGRWTFGFGRVGVLAAQVNGATLALVGGWIVYEAIRRLIRPEEVHGGLVLGVALAGVAVNLVATLVLARGSRASLNMRGAFLHLATDLAAFAGTAVAGLVILLTGRDRVDPIASLVVAALIFWSAWHLLRESGRIFLDVSPAGIDPDEVGRAIAAQPGVVETHDLHIWSLDDRLPALSAHVTCGRETDCHRIRMEIERMLQDRFGLQHTTLQCDHATQTGLVSLRSWRH